MYSAYNPNPMGARVGDCTVRAISRATGEGWDTVYCGLCVEGLRLCDMPTANLWKLNDTSASPSAIAGGASFFISWSVVRPRR